jgi:hypothetical protein
MTTKTTIAQDRVTLIHGKHGGARMETAYVNPGRHFAVGCRFLSRRRLDTVVSRGWILVIPRLLPRQEALSPRHVKTPTASLSFVLKCKFDFPNVLPPQELLRSPMTA